MFQTEDDEILVNEVAPRPHNSGHYYIEASYTTQFEKQWRFYPYQLPRLIKFGLGY
jgi:5-(carboxyamino)imidazole ribonucleotide synthase